MPRSSARMKTTFGLVGAVSAEQVAAASMRVRLIATKPAFGQFMIGCLFKYVGLSIASSKNRTTALLVAEFATIRGIHHRQEPELWRIRLQRLLLYPARFEVSV